MKGLLFLLWIWAMFVQEVVPGAIIRHPCVNEPVRYVSRPAYPTAVRIRRQSSHPPSSVHTEYEAKYQQKGHSGGESISTVTGKQEIVHSNCSDNWNEFAEKCATLIKDLVASLANAISSNPGDTTNLQLQIKNSFKHFDRTHNCSCFTTPNANYTKIELDLPALLNASKKIHVQGSGGAASSQGGTRIVQPGSQQGGFGSIQRSPARPRIGVPVQSMPAIQDSSKPCEEESEMQTSSGSNQSQMTTTRKPAGQQVLMSVSHRMPAQQSGSSMSQTIPQQQQDSSMPQMIPTQQFASNTQRIMSTPQPGSSISQTMPIPRQRPMTPKPMLMQQSGSFETTESSAPCEEEQNEAGSSESPSYQIIPPIVTSHQAAPQQPSPSDTSVSQMAQTDLSAPCEDEQEQSSAGQTLSGGSQYSMKPVTNQPQQSTFTTPIMPKLVRVTSRSSMASPQLQMSTMPPRQIIRQSMPGSSMSQIPQQEAPCDEESQMAGAQSQPTSAEEHASVGTQESQMQLPTPQQMPSQQSDYVMQPVSQTKMVPAPQLQGYAPQMESPGQQQDTSFPCEESETQSGTEQMAGPQQSESSDGQSMPVPPQVIVAHQTDPSMSSSGQMTQSMPAPQPSVSLPPTIQALQPNLMMSQTMPTSGTPERAEPSDSSSPCEDESQDTQETGDPSQMIASQIPQNPVSQMTGQSQPAPSEISLQSSESEGPSEPCEDESSSTPMQPQTTVPQYVMQQASQSQPTVQQPMNPVSQIPEQEDSTPCEDESQTPPSSEQPPLMTPQVMEQMMPAQQSVTYIPSPGQEEEDTPCDEDQSQDSSASQTSQMQPAQQPAQMIQSAQQPAQMPAMMQGQPAQMIQPAQQPAQMPAMMQGQPAQMIQPAQQPAQMSATMQGQPAQEIEASMPQMTEQEDSSTPCEDESQSVESVPMQGSSAEMPESQSSMGQPMPMQPVGSSTSQTMPSVQLVSSMPQMTQQEEESGPCEDEISGSSEQMQAPIPVNQSSQYPAGQMVSQQMPQQQPSQQMIPSAMPTPQRRPSISKMTPTNQQTQMMQEQDSSAPCEDEGMQSLSGSQQPQMMTTQVPTMPMAPTSQSNSQQMMSKHQPPAPSQAYAPENSASQENESRLSAPSTPTQSQMSIPATSIQQVPSNSMSTQSQGITPQQQLTNPQMPEAPCEDEEASQGVSSGQAVNMSPITSQGTPNVQMGRPVPSPSNQLPSMPGAEYQTIGGSSQQPQLQQPEEPCEDESSSSQRSSPPSQPIMAHSVMPTVVSRPKQMSPTSSNQIPSIMTPVPAATTPAPTIFVQPTIESPAYPMQHPAHRPVDSGYGKRVVITTPQSPTTFQTTAVSPTAPQRYVPVPTPASHPQVLLFDKPETTSPRSQTSGEVYPSATQSSYHHDDEDDYDYREDVEEDDDSCCSCESCTDEQLLDPKCVRKTACRDLEEARRELKAIFDKIKKKLKCGRRIGKVLTTVSAPYTRR